MEIKVVVKNIVDGFFKFYLIVLLVNVYYIGVLGLRVKMQMFEEIIKVKDGIKIIYLYIL